MSNTLVSVGWLQDHLADPTIAIVDCRFALTDPTAGQQHYHQGHIPGAHYLDLNRHLAGPVQRHGGRHPLPSIPALTATLRQIGVNSTGDRGPTLVVAYDDSRFAFAARLWWLLRYLGHERVAVLDGGWAAWQAAGAPIETAAPTAQPGNFTPQVQPQAVVDIHQVKAQKDQPGVVLVDSREGDRYRGEREPIDPVAGHIPGAVNYPWAEVTDAQGLARSPAEHRDRWAAIADADTIMVYCGSGVTACVNLLSLDLAGITTGKLYVGSWSDWCSYLPVAEAEAP